MIIIRAQLGDGHLSLEVNGHENHAEGGRVCAAVSAVVQTALLGLEHLAEIHPQHIEITVREDR